MPKSPISIEAQRFGDELDAELNRMRTEWFAHWRHVERGIDVENFSGGRFQSSGFEFDQTTSQNFWRSVDNYLSQRLFHYAGRIEQIVGDLFQNRRRELDWLAVRLEGFANQIVGEAQRTYSAATGESASVSPQALRILGETKRQLGYQIRGIDQRQLALKSRLRAFFNMEFARQTTLNIISAAIGFVSAWWLKP